MANRADERLGSRFRTPQSPSHRTGLSMREDPKVVGVQPRALPRFARSPWRLEHRLISQAKRAPVDTHHHASRRDATAGV
jgi:hypothetical protein